MCTPWRKISTRFEEARQTMPHQWDSRRNSDYRMDYSCYRVGLPLVVFYLLFGNQLVYSATTPTTTTTPQTTTTESFTTTTTPPTTTTIPETTTATPPTTTTTQPTTTTTPPTTTIAPSTTTTPPLPTTTTPPTTTTTLPKITTTPTTTTASPTTISTPTTTVAPTTTTRAPTTTTTPAAQSYCSDHPCKNGGTCNNIGTTYNCSCAGGYTNYSCEIEINECDPLPCYPFGDCVDRINNYSCFCRPGFQNVSGSDQNCTEINECDQYYRDHPSEAVCLNNGTCIDIINGFYCECRQIYEDLIIFGDRCDQNVSRYNTSSFTRISMTKGIQAGGSALTINGKGINIIPPIGAYFNASDSGLGVLFGYLVDGSVQSTQFIVLTPKAPNDTYIEVPLTISVLLSGGIIKYLPGSVTFQYVGNPSITDIEPKTQLASGGVKLTVIGSNLDAVGTPQMTVTLKEITAQNETGDIITYPPQTCFGATGDQMTCQMPKFNLSDASNDAKTTQDPSAKSRKKRHLFLSFYSSFVEKTQNFYRTLIWNSKNPTFSYTSMPDSLFNDGRLLKRHRRSSGNDNPVSTFTINNKTYNLFLKFTLDSYPKYEDLSKSLPNITFTLVDSRPDFPSGTNKQQQSFDPSQNEPIIILGDSLSIGVSKADYSVAVGAGFCNITDLAHNSITCSAPADRPEQGNDSIYCSTYSDNYLAVMVTAVGDKYFAYCITYTSGPLDTEEIFIIIGLCVGLGGILLLLITVIVCVVITKRRRRNKHPYPPDGRDHPGQLPLHSFGNTSRSNADYNNIITGYDNNIDASESIDYSQSIDTPDAAGTLYARGIDASENEPSSQPSNRRPLNAKPFGYLVRPGKRISFTRPSKGESMHESSQRQSKDNETSSGQNHQRYLTDLSKFASRRSASSDDDDDDDYPNMQNFPSGSRNILQELNEEVELDGGYSRNIDRENDERGRHLYGEVLRRKPEGCENPTTEIKRRNLPSYYPPINDSKDDGLRRQPERSEYPTNDEPKVNRRNVNTYYPPVDD